MIVESRRAAAKTSCQSCCSHGDASEEGVPSAQREASVVFELEAHFQLSAPSRILAPIGQYVPLLYREVFCGGRASVWSPVA
eukprot:2678670-Heterocapsa_arctica.AAC.1